MSGDADLYAAVFLCFFAFFGLVIWIKTVIAKLFVQTYVEWGLEAKEKREQRVAKERLR